MTNMFDAVLFCYSDDFKYKLAETDSEESIPRTRKNTHMSNRERKIERRRIARKKAVKSNIKRRNPLKYHRWKHEYEDPYANLARRKLEEKYSLARGLKEHVEELEDEYLDAIASNEESLVLEEILTTIQACTEEINYHQETMELLLKEIEMLHNIIIK